jgi:indolepyruvate ferredoxin oxidoreductase beta subunit
LRYARCCRHEPTVNARGDLPRREPIAVLIAALGGQGGGVLTNWLVQAARADGLVVQGTSTPGVSQRTGATTYYVEMIDASTGAQPVLGLAPVPARVDVLACAELLEAARMIERGMCSPSRTVVIASTRRVHTTQEKMGRDGRFDDTRIVEAIGALSRRAVLFDMEAVRARHRAALSAVLFGALAGSGALPLSRAACVAAIEAAGVGVTSSLAAFDDAFALAASASSAPTPSRAGPIGLASAAPSDALPADLSAIVAPALAQLGEYQDARYAQDYFDRAERLATAAAGRGPDVREALREALRQLAMWMAYDDVIRVAWAKSRRSRFDRIRAEAGARDDDVVRVRDYLRPGVDEIAAVLPRRLGAWLERRARARPGNGTPGRSVTLHSSSIAGAIVLRALAALRPLRRHSLRFAREQAAIGEWVGLVEAALRDVEVDAEGVMALAKLPAIAKGYGETHAAGTASFERAIAAYREQGPSALQALARSGRTAPACAPAAATVVQPLVFHRR